MTRVEQANRDHDVELAIARVLEAERSARAAIAAARAEGSATNERARAAARALAERTERRIGRIRERFEGEVAAEVAALDRSAAALDLRYAPTPADLAALERAIARLAAEITEGAGERTGGAPHPQAPERAG
jgi:hypothetical protein